MAAPLTAVLLIANAVLGIATTGFAVLAAVRPTALSHSEGPTTTGERFYASMYTARGVPLGLLAAVVPLVAPGPGAALALVAAAGAQVGDVVIGAARRVARMAVGACVVAVVHVVTAVVVG